MATLTGAIGIALAHVYSGAFSTSDALWSEIEKAGNESFEKFWRMPLAQEYRNMIGSDLADLKNTGGRLGGACTAAAFLKEFVNIDRWAHLDIAGTTLPSSRRESNYTPKGMAGFPVRAMVSLVRNAGIKGEK